MIPFWINADRLRIPAEDAGFTDEQVDRLDAIRNLRFEFLQHLADELKAQGVTSLLPPQTMVLDLEIGILTYETFNPPIRSVRQSGTLWPKRLPVLWRRNGVPTKTRRTPLPHPWRLVDLVHEYGLAQVNAL